MSRCKKCGREISFAITKNGKRQPINPDGSNHFSSCTGRPQKRKPSQHTPKQQPPLIITEGCPEGCQAGWVTIEREGRSGVVPCSIHRKSA